MQVLGTPLQSFTFSNAHVAQLAEAPGSDPGGCGANPVGIYQRSEVGLVLRRLLIPDFRPLTSEQADSGVIWHRARLGTERL